MKTIVKFTFLILCTVSFGQNNLLDTSSWTVGSGSVTGFSRNGSDAENIREVGTNPHGTSSILWKAVPDATSNADGGWNSSYHNIDPSKTYRYSVWIKKTNSTDGHTYFGMYSINASSSHSTLLLNGTERSNAYFWIGDLPELDKWYLLIGFLHESGYSGANDPSSGVYDGATGVKVLNATDFKFRADANRICHRSYLYYDINTADRQFFWGPTIYEVNGQEPTISEMLDPSGSSGGGTGGYWTQTGTDIHYSNGSVAVGTSTIPSGYKMAVDGKLITEEVKVQLSGSWPDYVFDEDYDLPTLEEVQKHIDEKGHLPNIPSAEEVEKNGVELGEMDRLLLEKIEELTLHVIQLKNEIKKLKTIQK